eukprot:8500344-Lingulodinium_polyedra.AAC.1
MPKPGAKETEAVPRDPDDPDDGPPPLVDEDGLPARDPEVGFPAGMRTGGTRDGANAGRIQAAADTDVPQT